MESVWLKNGRQYRGLIQSETPAEIELIEIVQPAAKPMFLVIRPIDPRDVLRIERLPKEERAKLVQRTQRFRNRIRIEAGRMEHVKLRDIVQDGIHYRQYVGNWFTLSSTADEETTRRCVVRVDQIFRAYRQLLPPKTKRRSTLRFVVFGSMDEYRDQLRRQKLPIDNPAFFVAQRNLIVAGSELTRFAQHLAAARQRHEAVRKKYDTLKAELPTRLLLLAKELKRAGVDSAEIGQQTGAQRRAFEQEYNTAIRKINAADRRNEAAFADVTRQMFRRLYHEAFHAYVENYVYPSAQNDVPLWLNEGLAQVFESGQLDGDTLRIDAPDRVALTQLQANLAQGKGVSPAQLLTAEQGKFGVTHYVHSWGLAYYLTFLYHDPLLGTPTLDRYVAKDADVSGKDPAAKFEQLIGMPLAKFEPQWQKAMVELQPPR